MERAYLHLMNTGNLWGPIYCASVPLFSLLGIPQLGTYSVCVLYFISGFNLKVFHLIYHAIWTCSRLFYFILIFKSFFFHQGQCIHGWSLHGLADVIRPCHVGDSFGIPGQVRRLELKNPRVTHGNPWIHKYRFTR